MPKSKNFRRKFGGDPSPRSGATRQPREVVVIFTEGLSTEPRYLELLKQKFRLANVKIRPVGCEPKKLVKEAKKYAENLDNPEAQIWCVFDHDGHPQYASASADALSSEYKLARSVPCFEIWLSLHFKFSTAPLGDSKTVIKSALCRHIPGYDKTDLPDSIVEDKYLQSARDHAEQLERFHIENGNDCPCSRECNPSTEMHHLLARIRDFK